MLDQFSAVKIEDNTSAPSDTSAPTTAPPTGPEIPDLDGISDEDFAKQFQASMAELMGEMNNNPDMASQFEAMMKELASASQISEAAGMSPGPSPSAPKPGESAKKAAPAAAGASEESFQGKIKKTMERMQESGQKASDAAAADDSEDMLAEIMKQMAAGGGMEGEGGEEEFSKMLLGMMEQLTHKEILYEPMKELNDKYPEWMEKNKDKISKEELTRFQEQQVVVKEIVDRFESKTYSDSNAADREYIVERMEKVCAEFQFQSVCGTDVANVDYRCKGLALHPRIWWGICRPHRKRSVHRKKAVLSNNKSIAL